MAKEQQTGFGKAKTSYHSAKRNSRYPTNLIIFDTHAAFDSG